MVVIIISKMIIFTHYYKNKNFRYKLNDSKSHS
jgi:hypothetical protein